MDIIDKKCQFYVYKLTIMDTGTISLKKRNKTVREEWSTKPPRISPLIQSVAQPVIASPSVRKTNLSKEGQFYMCSECPYSAEEWMTAFAKKNINSEGKWMKFQTKNRVINVDKQAYEQLKVSFMKVCVKTHKTCFDVVVVTTPTQLQRNLNPTIVGGWT